MDQLEYLPLGAQAPAEAAADLPVNYAAEAAPDLPQAPDNVGIIGSMRALANRLIPSLPEAETAVFNLAQECGFAAVVLRRSRRDPETGVYKVTDLECSRGKVARTTSSGSRRTAGIRQTPISRCGCEWRSVIKRTGDEWMFTLSKDERNHPRLAGHLLPSNRRRQRRREDVSQSIDSLVSLPKLTATDIERRLRDNFPGTGVVASDIQNIRQQQRLVQLQGRTPTQQFFHELQQMGALLVYLTAGGENAPLEYIFWTFPWCLERWEENWEMLSIDDTYKTNRFNMPLMQVTGVAGVNTTFNVAWGLLKDEKEESHRWASNQLKRYATERRIRQPLVIISDFDNAFRAAASEVFPNTASQLCVWHVMKNVAYHMKVKWDGSLEGTELARTMAARGGRRREDDEAAAVAASGVANNLVDGDDLRVLGNQAWRPPNQQQQQQQEPVALHANRSWTKDADGMLQAWRDVVYAPTRREYEELWTKLQREFDGQHAILHYLKQTYLPVINDFAIHSTKRHRNYGVKATSRTESSHAAMKKQLRNRTGDLHVLHRSILEMLERQKQGYERTTNYQRERVLAKAFGKPIFAEMQGISHVAMQKVVKSESEAREAVRDPRGKDFNCTGLYNRQFGLPCWHTMLPLVRNGVNARLPRVAIDGHWYLWKEGIPADVQALHAIQDPVVNPRRQAPGARPGDAHRRDPGHDDLPPGLPLQAQVAQPTQQPAQQPAPRAPSRCSRCGQEGHRSNSWRCARHPNNPANAERAPPHTQ